MLILKSLKKSKESSYAKMYKQKLKEICILHFLFTSNHIRTGFLKKICIKANNRILHSLKPNEHQTAEKQKNHLLSMCLRIFVYPFLGLVIHRKDQIGAPFCTC